MAPPPPQQQSLYQAKRDVRLDHRSAEIGRRQREDSEQKAEGDN
jgi:hypothetical protein